MTEPNLLLTDGDLEDIFTDAIADSIDMDWTAREGALSIVRSLKRAKLKVIVAPHWEYE